MVGDEAVDEFPGCIHEKECRTDHSQLRGIQQPRVNDRFFHYVEARAANVVQAVTDGRSHECLHVEPAIAGPLFLLRPLNRGRSGNAVEIPDLIQHDGGLFRQTPG